MNKIVMVLFAIVFLSFAACSKPASEQPQDIQNENVVAAEEPDELNNEAVIPMDSVGSFTLDDFRNSQFVELHNCIDAGSWDLRNGNVNRSYDVDVHALEFEIQPESNIVVGIGLIFFERRTLNESDVEIITDLLNSLDASKNHDDSISLITENIETRISQIDKAELIDDGVLRIWAGKVGAEQTVHIEF